MGRAQRQAKAASKLSTLAAQEAQSAFSELSGPYEKLISLGLPFLIFIVYFLTLCPSLSGGDSGELITVARTLGVAHPPGYPLFTLLGKAFTWIPFGNVAWRVNLLSALCDSAAAAFLLQAVFRWTGNIWAGALTAGLFAFSPLIWTYAVPAEVFGLNNLFVAALFFMAVQTVRDTRPSLVYFSAFLFGLGLSNHHTLLFYGAPIILWMILRKPTTFLRPRGIAIMMGLFSLGLVPYAYLPWAPLDSRQPFGVILDRGADF